MCSDGVKVKNKAKNFFDVCHLFFDFLGLFLDNSCFRLV